MCWKSYLRFFQFLVFELLASKRLQKMRKKLNFRIISSGRYVIWNNCQDNKNEKIQIIYCLGQISEEIWGMSIVMFHLYN